MRHFGVIAMSQTLNTMRWSTECKDDCGELWFLSGEMHANRQENSKKRWTSSPHNMMPLIGPSCHNREHAHCEKRVKAAQVTVVHRNELLVHPSNTTIFFVLSTSCRNRSMLKKVILGCHTSRRPEALCQALASAQAAIATL